jgi:hypothetical protein
VFQFTVLARLGLLGDWMTLTQAAALLTAGTTLAGGAWVAGDYTGMRPVIKKEYDIVQADQTQILKGLVQQQEQQMKSIFELQFQTYDLKRQRGGLDWSERQKYCSLAKKLDYVGVEDCE